MKYCLLDTENICRILASTSSKYDEIILFVSPRCSKPKIQIRSGNALHTKLTVVPVVGRGKDNMDAHITAYCGYLFGQISDAELTIISNDTGFDNVRAFWKSRGRIVKRQGYNIKAKSKKVISKSEAVNKKASKGNVPSTSNVKRKNIDIPKISIKVHAVVKEFLDLEVPLHKSIENLSLYMEKRNYSPFRKMKKSIIAAGYLVGAENQISRRVRATLPPKDVEQLPIDKSTNALASSQRARDKVCADAQQAPVLNSRPVEPLWKRLINASLYKSKSKSCSS